ncbi:SPOR domain-containing protein [Marinimicrobium sp. ARAG 43.8]|uniref:SPOR domain-containing protein n=1 Tax=Marinimicrobium sp. ARAG 43.8 TaxID=3418719 RepID=UPI003CFA26E5
MRAIFLVLVMINLGLLAAHWFSAGEKERPVASPEEVSPVAGGASLTLLSETARELPRRAETEVAPIEALAPPLCVLVGPYGAEEEAQAPFDRLRALDIDVSLEPLTVSDGRGYWVHLPPELSQRAALLRLHELQAKQIDSYVIPRGELANGISFGMFSREALAVARQEALRQQGYDAKIHEIERTHRELWLTMPSAQAAALDDSLWTQLIPAGSTLERRQNLCPGVASE